MNSVKVKEKLAPYIEYFAESTTACLVTMVQGNVLALGLGHLVIASQTGIAAGALAYIALLFAKTDKRWLVALVLGLATGIVDFFVHPGMFGTVATEAIVTGLGAAVLSYLVGTAIQRFRDRKAAAT
ncbi:MAG: hypothetical protein R3192_08695 [Woeseiaceae bacterium]|nr:hypothetical protein [Woeseiaceae bacterium]